MKTKVLFFSFFLFLVSFIGCKKSNCEIYNTSFEGTYFFDANFSIYTLEFENNFNEAELIVGENVENKKYPICCNPNFKKTTGKICFNLSLPDNSEIPINIGPGPVPENIYIKITEFYEN